MITIQYRGNSEGTSSTINHHLCKTKTMDFFDSGYYIINKNLHRCLGCWPYQKNWEKKAIRLFILLLNLSGLIPELLNFALCRHSLTLIIDALPVFLTHMMHIAKYSAYVTKSDEILELLNVMKRNWNLIQSEKECAIMREYASIGRLISLGMLIAYYICTALYLLMPLVPRFLDKYYPLNESRPFIYVFEAEYMIDRKTYYIPIYIHHCILAITMMGSIIATDTTYGVFVFHACGLFVIVRDGLVNMKIPNDSKNHMQKKYENKRNIIHCIKNHKRALNFCDMIENANSTAMFVILLTSMFSLTMTGLQTMTHLKQPPQALRFALFCIGHFIHIFYYCWTSQNIYNYSSEIYNAAYNAKWYLILDESAHLLKLMMFRSSIPCIQTAGKIFPMTLMNFTVIVKTSMSYFTVLSNFQ